MERNVFVSEAELAHQRECAERVRAIAKGETAWVDTYGCQQNEADSERMRGWLREMGYTLVDHERADVVVINSCAVREHAEQRVLGNIGHLTHTKRENPRQKIILAGCMAGEEVVREKIKKSYRMVDALLDTTSFWRLPETLLRLYEQGGRLIEHAEPDSRIAEGLPVVRTATHKAHVSIMYGCNNFCSYCIVPYVRGRERSRLPEDVIAEVKGLIDGGCHDIMLLGQNVNSYSGGGIDFAELLGRCAELDGDFVLRFMTSHPKDCSHKLIDTIASHPKIERHIHLPVQSGSDEILQRMNRRYTAEHYISLIDYAREKIPGVIFSSDIIVGFPNESDADFEATVELVKRVRYDSLFTFIYSKRAGTPAAEMDDPITHAEKVARFRRLTALQDEITLADRAPLVGKTLRVHVDGTTKSDELNLTARTQDGRLVNLKGSPELIGSWHDVSINGVTTFSLLGELI